MPLGSDIASMGPVLPVVGLAVSGAALAVSVGSAYFARRQVHLVERQRERDFGATVVAELVGFERGPEGLMYTLRVTNAGPATARDVDVSLVEWTDESAFGRALAEADVAPALLRGDHRNVRLVLRREYVRFDAPGVAVELSSGYYDDNGVRSERLALVLEETLIQLPPQPTLGGVS